MREHKKEIIKLSICALLLCAFFAATKIFSLPKIAVIIMFGAVYLLSSFSVYKEAAENIIKGEIFDENFLMCIASLGAFIIGQYAEAVFVMLFFGIGELFEEIATEKSEKNIKSLLDIRPDTACVIKDGKQKTVLAKDVNIGDTVIVRPGQRIPLDGTVSMGTTLTDNSALTGESVPQRVKKGDTVYSGTVNMTSQILVTVKKTFSHSTASKILELVESSGEKKAKSQKFITEFSRYYTPVICALALLLAVIPGFITGDFKLWIYRALMFLVVSCPCALVVSVPLSYFCGMGTAAKRGVLIKGAQYIETLSKLNTAVFDKTGTVTKGEFTVVAIHPEKVSENELLHLAAAAESGSVHPISNSLKAAYGKMPEAAIGEINEFAGLGVRAMINGKEVFAGSGEFMQKNGIEFKECSKTGSIVHVARCGEYLGHIVISDTLKPEAKEAIAALKSNKIKTVMLTGDMIKTAENIAKEVGIDKVYGELKPDGKVALLEKELNKSGTVAFIGDGINDAPVLRRADVGIAMGALGSDAAVECADVVLMNDNINGVLSAVKVAKRTQRTVKQNIIISLFIKFAVLILSALGIGVTNMWIASFADVGVLIIAVLNAVKDIFQPAGDIIKK